MKNKSMRILSLILTLMMLITAMPLSMASQAATVDDNSAGASVDTQSTGAGVSVDIVSFARGVNTGLRSSELLMAKVTGYDGDTSKLTYKWTNNLRTYLYIYNRHNMFSVNNTDGELEIYNSSYQSPTSKMLNAGRSFSGSKQAVGFQYASVYGANLDKNSFKGGIKVEVIKNGRVIATDIIGDMTKKSSTSSGILSPNLQEDMKSTVLGIFEGDSLSVTDLLGEAGIVHITCTECKVKEAVIGSGSEYAKVVNKNNVYYIQGLKEGKTTVRLNVTKDNCKFHQYDNDTNTCNADIHVFKKPKTETSATTLTLYDDLRIFYGKDDYKTYNYYIMHEDGTFTKGEVEVDPETDKEKIVFKGLKENTKYEIMVEAPYYEDSDTQHKNPFYAYGYVYDTTKQLVNATVNIKLDGIGTDADKVGLDSSTLVLHSVISGADYSLNKVSTGKYQARLGAGTYQVYDNGKRIGTEQLIVDAKDVETTLNFYSVKYNANGGTGAPADQIYAYGSIVEASSVVPTKEGQIFTGWKIDGTTIVQPDGPITYSIQAPIKLTAQWVDKSNVYVDVVIKHGKDIKKESTVSFSLSRKLPDEATYNKVFGTDITLTEASHNKYNYTYNSETKVSYFNATEPTYTGVMANYLYDIIGSEIENYSVSTTVTNPSKPGDPVRIMLVYTFNPNGHKINFSVKLDDTLNNGPDNLKPKSANIKVTTYDAAAGNSAQWRPIIQQADIAYNVPIGADGIGTGETVIWAFMQGDTKEIPYYFRIEVESVEYPDGTVVTVNPDAGQQREKATNFTDVNHIYSAKVNVTGASPQKLDGTRLTSEPVGIYFENDNKETQQTGTMEAVISANFYNVKFDATGGKVNGKDVDTVNNIYSIPLFRDFIPSRDGGYVFQGWYKDKECTQRATAGEIINSTNYTIVDNTVTLYAKWIEPVSVKGNVKMYYQYEYNNKIFDIIPADRPKSTRVVLQYKEGEVWKDLTSQSAVYENDINIKSLTENTAPFNFTGLDAVDANGNKIEYKIVVEHQNFTTKYTPDNNGNAIFSEDSVVAIENAELTFVPDTFNIGFEVKADDIVKEAVYPNGTKKIRPQSVNVVYEFVGQESGHGWETVVQHQNSDGTDDTVQGSFDTNGITTGNSYTLEAWKFSNITENQTKYEFRLKVVSYVDGNGNTVVPEKTSNIPFDIIIDNVEYYHGDNSNRKKAPSPVGAGDGTTPDVVLKAHIEPKDFSIFLDTGIEGAIVDTDTYFERGESSIAADPESVTSIEGKTEDAVAVKNGTVYEQQFAYGDVVDKLPIPQKADYKFLGWYELKYEQDTEGEFHGSIDTTPTVQPLPTSGFSSRYFVARWEKDENETEIIFHDNINSYLNNVDTDIFRIFSTAKGSTYPLTINQPLYSDASKNYELPVYDNNKLVFKGWYYDADPDNNSNPIDWNKVTNVIEGTTTDIYAHWILIDDVAQEADGKQIEGGMYNGFDLTGVQIRDADTDSVGHYGTEAKTGLRFITSLSKNVYEQVNSISADFEYGFVMAKSDTAKIYAGTTNPYELQYNGIANGIDNSENYKYAANVQCNGVADHFNGTNYRLYTAVITYDGMEGSTLENAHNTNMLARSYMKYTDANGLTNRVHYNDYTGISKLYDGCSTSFNKAKNLSNIY